MTAKWHRSKSLSCIMMRNSTTSTTPTEDHAEMANAKPMDEIPGPKGLPFIGTLLEYARNDGWGFKNLFTMTYNRQKKYGPIYKERMGNFNVVVVSTAEDAEKVLRAEGKYPDRSPIVPLVEYRKQNNLPMGVILS